MIWDRRSREYIYDHGWQISDDGKLQLTKKQFESAQHAGMSVLDPGRGVITMPSDFGVMLIKEEKHFVIV